MVYYFLNGYTNTNYLGGAFLSFTTKQLKALAYNTKAFDDGVDLFLDGMVSDLSLSYDMNAESHTPPINLNATVSSSDETTSFNVHIKLLKSRLLSMQCSCDNFVKTSNGCPHLLATLLHYSDDSDYWLSLLPELKLPKDEEPSPLDTQLSLNTENNWITLEIIWNYPEVSIDGVSKSVVGDLSTIVRDKEIEGRLKTLIGKYHFEFYKDNKLYLHRNNDIYEFIHSGLDEFKSFCELTTSPDFDQIVINPPSQSRLNIELQNNKLFLNFEHANIQTTDIQGLLDAYTKQAPYYRLASGNFLALDNISNEEAHNLGVLAQILETLIPEGSDRHSSEPTLPAYRALYLDQLLSNYATFSVSKNTAFRKLIDDITHAKTTEYTIPTSLHATLRDYQVMGFKWLKTLAHYGLGGILADDMGLGKTIQTITLLLSEADQVDHPSLIVCPTSLVLNWQHELSTFAPSLKVLIITGTPTERLNLLSQVGDYDVILTSYDILSRDIAEYQNINFHYCIADEAHYIKSRRTLKSKALKSVNSQIRFALTGTPIENSLAELWSLFDFVMPGYLFSHHKFQQEFELPISKEGDQEQATLLQSMTSPFILRRLKSDVLTELPAKTETVCYIPMMEDQETLYKTYVSTAYDELNTEIATLGFNRSHIKFLSLLTRLRQLCCHPKLCLPSYTGDCGKLDACLELVTNSIDAGHKVLIFSQFTSMLELLAKELTELNISHFTLRGSTPSEKRLDLVNDFNEGDTQVFLISLKAGGVGLNLTSADIVIHYDPWWNVSAQNQATDRAHRIGQLNPVQVYKLITQNSIEEKIELLQQQKLDLTEQVLQRGETFLNQLTQEEVMKLFEF